MSPETAVNDRWLSHLIWQSILSTPIYLLSIATTHLLRRPVAALFFYLPLFLLSLVLFSIALSLPLVSSAAASPFAILRFAFSCLLFGGSGRVEDLGWRRRAAAAGRLAGCVLVCGVAGVLSAVAVSGGEEWGWNGLKGAVSGLGYGGWFVLSRRWVLKFQIIQRPLFFSYKIGLSSCMKRALKLSCISYFCTTALMLLFSEMFRKTGSLGKFIVDQITFFFGITITFFCWEQSCHLFQVIQTRRLYFAPPKGSAAAETNPSELLISALEQSTPKSLYQNLAYLDLCMVCESNVDSWRRAALYEETGETYRKVIVLCIRPLDQLTSALAYGLDGALGSKTHDLSRQLHSSAVAAIEPNLHEAFISFQLYTWCARSISALTARSHNEDRFGVAQLTGSNASVISCLLSCLLAVEACLGKKTSPQSSNSIGPAKIKWATVNTGRIDSPSAIVAKKRSRALYDQSYAMVDVLRTSIYGIVSAFHEEMQASLKTSSLEKDWISPDKILYGTKEILLHKLTQFLDFRA